MKKGNVFFLVLLVFLFSISIVKVVEAMPVFARRYSLSCEVCHVGMPKINSFGEDFAGNGYQLPDEDVRQHGVDLKEEKLLLLPAIPLAVRADMFLRARGDTDTHSDIQSPFLMKLLSSAPITNNISYYFYFLFTERGSVTGIEDAFIFFNNFYKGQDLDLRFGQFQVSEILFPREQRLTFQDFTYYITAVSDSGFKLTYDRAAELSYSFEVTKDVGMSLVAATANGNGIGLADSDRNFDSDDFKNFYGKVSLKTDRHKIGVYSYYGRERNSQHISNDFFRVGPDFNFIFLDDVNLWGNFLYGEDNNPAFSSASQQMIKSRGGLVGLTYPFSEDWILSLLYNIVEVNERAKLNAETFTANISYYHMLNFKIMVEFTGDLKEESPSHPQKTHNGVIGLVLAF